MLFSDPPPDGKYDVVFKTTDDVFLYVDSSRLPRGWLPSLDSPNAEVPKVDIAESSSVLNVILHALYDVPFSTDCLPSIDLLDQAIDCMPVHKIRPASYIVPERALYRTLLALALKEPYRVYALAAFHDIRDLVVEVSRHTLSKPIDDISEHLARRMGAICLRDLVSLHITRRRALKDIVEQSPASHPPTETCGPDQHIALGRAWSLKVAELLLSDIVLEGVPGEMLRDLFAPLTMNLDCVPCVESLTSNVNEVIARWALVKDTL